MQPPSHENIMAVLQVLYQNGIAVSNSKQAYANLQQYRDSPQFAQLLCHVFASTTELAPQSQTGASWVTYRQLAGITLKNNLHHGLGEELFTVVAQACVAQLRQPTSFALLRTAAQTVVKLTSLTSLDWWQRAAGIDLPSLLLHDLLVSNSHLTAFGALYVLQYLLEDIPTQIGAASEHIVNAVTQHASNPSAWNTHSNPIDTRFASFRVGSSPFEYGALLEWNVDELSAFQNGLTSSAHNLANACTVFLNTREVQANPTRLATVFRTMVLLLDYLDYMPQFLTQEQQTKMASEWIAVISHVVQHPENSNRECVAAAIDVISAVLNIYERNGGEGQIVLMYQAATTVLPAFIPKLFQYIMLTAEEVSNLLETDDAVHRDQTAVSQDRDGKAGIEETNGLEEDEAAVTLRRSASWCVDRAATSAGRIVFDAILHEISTRWVNASNWETQEAAILGFGSAVTGCFSSFEPHFAALTEQLLGFVSASGSHVCTTAMSMWALSRMDSWIFTTGMSFAERVLRACTPHLLSHSKRVQQSAITSLRSFLRTSTETGSLIPPPVLFEIVGNVHQGLTATNADQSPLYHTTNLSLLCDLSVTLSVAIPAEHLGAFAGPFFNIRTQKMTAFEQSYYATVIEQTPNAAINKDVMSIDRVVMACLTLVSSEDTLRSVLSTWSNVIQDIAQRKAFDDMDLIYNAISITGGFLGISTTAFLQQWAASEQQTGGAGGPKLLANVLAILDAAPFHDVLSENALKLSFRYIKVLGCPQELESQYFHTLLTKFLQNEVVIHYPSLLFTASSAVCAAAETSSNAQAVQQVVAAVARNLRPDAFGDSLLYYVAMVGSVCGVLERTGPSLLNSLPVDHMCALLAKWGNDSTKHYATLSLCNALSQSLDANPALVAHFLRGIMKMLYSWQQAATQPAFGAIRGLLHRVLSNPALQGIVAECQRDVPPTFWATFVQTYEHSEPQQLGGY